MKSKNFFIPDGVEYYMPQHAIKFEKLKSSILKIYSKYKYQYIIPPIFDSLDNLLNLKSTDLDSQTTFVLDKSSRSEVGIRADITPQISRIDYQISKGKANSKFSYMGDILRLSPGPFDRLNPYQTGAEFFGAISKSVDVEIIKLMIDIISLSKEDKVIIELGDLSFVNNLLNELELIPEEKSILIDLINFKSKLEINDFFKKNKLNNKKLILLTELLNLSGDINVLKELKLLISSFNLKLTNEFNELTAIAKAINKFRGISEVQIDLCELHGFNYQSSLIYLCSICTEFKERSCAWRKI